MCEFAPPFTSGGGVLILLTLTNQTNMEKKIFLIAVDIKDESRHIGDFAFRKVIATSKDEAKQQLFEELQGDYEFEEFEEFEDLVHFCDEIDTTTPSQRFGIGY